jgi:hypothetical protein
VNRYPMPIPEHYTPEQVLAILDLLEVLHNTIRNVVSQLQLEDFARAQLDLFADHDDPDNPSHLDEMPF